MSGHTESTNKTKKSDLETGGSYSLSIMLGYRSKAEYGVGLNYSNFTQGNEEYPTESTETRPVLWVGLNW